jgi:hypothetical protein
MKKLFYSVTLFPLCILLSPWPLSLGGPLIPERVNELVVQIQKKYVPDRTTALFQVKLNEDPNTVEVESTEPAAITEFERLLKQESVSATVISMGLLRCLSATTGPLPPMRRRWRPRCCSEHRSRF